MLLSNWVSDVRLALRGLRHSPVFATVAIGSLALGMGANTAIFTLVDQLLLRSMPVDEPGQLVRLKPAGLYAGSVYGPRTFSYPMYRDLRDRGTALQGLLAHFPSDLNLQVEESSERVAAAFVSGNYFEVLGVRPSGGRLLHAGDDQAGNPAAVAVISHGFWKRRFGADSSVIGKTVRINGQPALLVGVTAPGFLGIETGRARDVYVPIAMRPRLLSDLGDLEQRSQYWVRLMGRLKPGVEAKQAQADLDLIYRPRIEADFLLLATRLTDEAKKELAQGLRLEPGGRGLPGAEGQFEEPLWFLSAVVGLVLLIACVNLANLLLARSAGRQREIAIRRALGAQNAHLARLALAESLLLAFAGGGIGLLLAGWGTEALVSFLPDDTITRALRTQPDWRIAGFAFTLSLVTALLFGAAPAWNAVRGSVTAVLGEGSARLAGASFQIRSRKVLAVVQVALSLLLLIGAGLFARSLTNLKNVQTGYRTDHLLQFSLDASANGYPQKRVRQVYADIIQRLTALPGVRSASYASNGLLSGDEWQGTVNVQGYQPKPGENMNLALNFAAPGFFETVGIPLVAGRGFNERDLEGSTRPVVLSESAAKRFFGDRSPLGHRMEQGRPGKFNLEIVGVVADHRMTELKEQQRGILYLPTHSESFIGEATFYVKTSQDPETLAEAARREAGQVDATLALFGFKTLDRQRDESLYLERLTTMLSMLFAVLATFLAALGLYGVMAYSVAWRTREIGIRIALGAERASVLGMVLREVGWLTLFGVGLGLPAALALSRLLRSQLFGLAPNDPATLGAATLLLILVAGLAGFIPAWRASRVDPIVALRYE
jgi:predicted permease